MENSITTQTHVIFPEMLYDRGVLFDGNLLKWMDEVAYIAITRLLHMHKVTVAVEKVKFLKPILHGHIFEITSRVQHVGNVKAEMRVEAFCSHSLHSGRIKCAEATFYFTALNDAGKPIRINGMVANGKVAQEA